MCLFLVFLFAPIVQACEPGPSGIYLINSQDVNTLCTEFPSLQAALETLDKEEESEVIVQGGQQAPHALVGLTIAHKTLRIVGILEQLQITYCNVQGNVTLVGWDVVQLDGQVRGILTLIDCRVRDMGRLSVTGRLVIDICVFLSFQTGEISLISDTSELRISGTSFQQIVLLSSPLISSNSGASIHLSNVTIEHITTPSTFPILSLKTAAFPTIFNAAQFSNCSFLSNSALLLEVHIHNYHLSFENCTFEGNTQGGLSLSQTTGQTLFSNCNWRGNSWALVLIRELHGEVVITGGEVTDHSESPPFVSANSGTTAVECLFMLNDVLIHDINYTISPYSPFSMGLFYVVNCVAVLHSVNITHAYTFGPTSAAMQVLIGTMNGALELTNCHLSHIGGTGGIISPFYGSLILNQVKIEEFLTKQGAIIFSVVSQITIFDLIITKEAEHNQDFRPDLTLLAVTLFSGALTYRSILITNLTKYTMDLPLFLVGCTAQGSDLQLTNIKSKFGVLVHSGSALLTNTTIIGGQVLSPLIVTADSKARFEGVTIADMQGIDGVIHMLPSSNGEFVYVDVRNVSGEWTFRAAAANLTADHFSVTGSHFRDLIRNVVNSRVQISYLTAIDSSGELVSAFSSFITLDHVTLQNCDSPGALISTDAVTLALSHVIIKNYRCAHSLGRMRDHSALMISQSDWSFVMPNDLLGLGVRDGSVVIEDSRFSNISGGIFAVDQSNVRISRCRFEAIGQVYHPGDLQKIYGAVILAKNSQINLTETTVIGTHALNGGAIFALLSPLSVEKSWFEGCSAAQGGALYVKDSSISLTSSKFANNQADLGGALYFDSDYPATVRNSFLHGNLATEGGAVKWTLSPVAFINTTFQNNVADYGPDTASFPIDVRLLYDVSAFTLVSGTNLPVPLVFELVDEFGQVVKTAKKTQLTLQPAALKTYKGTNFLLGNHGIYNFSTHPFHLPPGLSHTLSIHINGTDSFRPLAKQVDYPLHFRNCTAGEVYQSDQCITCPVGMYSFSPDDKECLMCPPHANCEGRTNFHVSSGYWRSGVNTSLLFECPLASSCLGGNASSCAQGYEGKLCSECATNYTRIGTSRCVECEQMAWTIGQFCLLGIALALYLTYIVYFTLTNNAKNLALLRILATHSQVLVLILHLKIELPSVIRGYLHAVSLSTGLSIANLPYSCLYDASSAAYISAIVAVIWPIAVLAVSLFCLFSLSSKGSRMAAGSLITAVAHLTIPSAMEALSGLIPCVSLDNGEEWLFADTQERCFTRTYSLFASYIFISSTLLYGVIALIGLLAYGCCRREQLGYQSAEYQPHYWFWEVVVLIWKLVEAISIRIAVFRQPLFQITTFFISAVFFIVLFAGLEPLKSPYLHFITMFAYLSLCFSYGGAVYLTELSATEGLFRYFGILIVVGLNSLLICLLLVCMCLPQKAFDQQYRVSKAPRASTPPNTSNALQAYEYHPSLLQVPHPSPTSPPFPSHSIPV